VTVADRLDGDDERTVTGARASPQVIVSPSAPSALPRRPLDRPRRPLGAI
jgi:hypothetical protein